jgi:hypothetical protein
MLRSLVGAAAAPTVDHRRRCRYHHATGIPRPPPNSGETWRESCSYPLRLLRYMDELVVHAEAKWGRRITASRGLAFQLHQLT